MPLYPVDNDYPDEFKIPPANRVNNPGTLTLYPASTGFEKALADTDAERLMDLYAEAIIDQWNPWQVASEHLPFLAWAHGVNLWEDWWDDTFRRSWTARQWYLKSIRGKRAGLNEFVNAVGGSVKRCIVPPARAYGTKALTDAERAAYVARFPQLRIYPYVERAKLPWLCYNGVHWNGTGKARVWNKNGSFLGPRRRVYPTVQTAGGKYTRTAVLYEPRTGVETKLTIRRIVKINTGPTSAWGYTPGVSAYDESVILPLEHRPAYFIREPRKYLGFNIYAGIDLPLRTISIGRSGYLDLIQGKAQYQTVFPDEELLKIRPEYVGIKHPRRKTELYAARGEYLVKAKSIVTHAIASDLITQPPVFGRALYGLHANPFILQGPVFGTPPTVLEFAALDPATTAWIDGVGLAGGTAGITARNLVNNFILGLRADNIWNRFDRIWLTAAENQQSARVDLKVGTRANPVGSPVFTANQGYDCTLTAYLDTTYNFITDAVTFSQNSAHLSCWNSTTGVNVDAEVRSSSGATLRVLPKLTADNKTYISINDSSAGFTAPPDVRGLLLGNRSSATTREAYQNGVSMFSYGTVASTAVPNSTLQIYTRQTAAVSVGGSLTQVEQLAFYNRLKTYMTALNIILPPFLYATSFATSSPVLSTPTAFVDNRPVNLSAGHPVLATPTLVRVTPPPLLANGQAYTDQDRGMFLTYNFATFVGTEFLDATVWPTNTFAPTGMDPAQWAAVAKEFNCKYAVLVIKHQDGFTLWPTTTTNRGLVNTDWYATHGNFDITQAYVDAFRAAGVLPCFYFSVLDTYWVATHPSWTNLQYKDFAQSQITEVLTRYGQIAAIWLDSTYPWMGNSWAPWASAEERNAFIRSVSPGIIILDNNYRENLSETDVISYESGGGGPSLPAGNTNPAESSFSIGGPTRWFWKSDDEPIYDAGTISTAIINANSNNASVLINVPPNTAGIIPTQFVKRLQQVQQILHEVPSATPFNMTSNTVPSPYVASASSEYPDPGNRYQAYRAFNPSLAYPSYWGSNQAGAGLPAWIQIDLGSAKNCASYMVQTASTTHQWFAWTLAGSNNGSTWTTAHTVTGAAPAGFGTTQFYDITPPVSYRYWRWTITSTASGTDADILHLALYGIPGPVTAESIITGSPQLGMGLITGGGPTTARNLIVGAPSFGTPTMGPDVDTSAWVAAVVGSSGNVSSTLQGYVNALVVGLKTDGVWPRIDRLWLHAVEDVPSALRDLKVRDAATLVNAPLHTPNRGFTGNQGAGAYIDTTYNPSTDGVNYTANALSAIGGVWDLTSSAADGACVIGAAEFGIFSIDGTQRWTDGNSYWRGNASNGSAVAYPGPGLFIENRNGAATDQLYYNGVEIASSGVGVSTFPSRNIYLLARNQGGTAVAHSNDQVAATVFGGAMTAAQHLALYNRLRTFLTNVGAV